MKLKNVFQRKETKYLLTTTQFHSFIEELKKQMQIDDYGLHTILSLYFDTADDRFITNSMNKPRYKEKFRVRSYGVPTDSSLVFLEIKKKVNGIVYKRRLPLTYSEYLKWLQTKDFPSENHEQIQQEVDWLFRRNPDLSPKTMIIYERMSLFGKTDPDFRVTFDQHIRFRQTNLDLAITGEENLVAPELGVLMEVKALGAYPLWFVELLNAYQLRKGSFSKYAETYKRHLFIQTKEENQHVI
ncbi:MULTISPECIES: polyphosphate polymerase domain-containing protein [unclassified Enterococcus]|uniref:polyphosphate polymerase domain-containing protein n=1 Tax=unclassified Enterococcus TaxID=2608891 RepID=UPI001A9A97AA|nr:polyphosphate polymerase domain-containing protein [Enterococcus sp. DIV1271a]MBO1299163.1 polyphosphate polymerase domain-containing protein [Enterococcus sp. DIV1271a]